MALMLSAKLYLPTDNNTLRPLSKYQSVMVDAKGKTVCHEGMCILYTGSDVKRYAKAHDVDYLTALNSFFRQVGQDTSGKSYYVLKALK